MRRFLFSTSMISALAGLFGVIRATTKGPRDWRLALIWIGWLATLGLAIGTVIESDERSKLD